MITEFSVISKNKNEMIDITEELNSEIHKSKASEGFCIIYTPHTTAAITINENADPDVCADIIKGLKNISPDDKSYRHTEGNSDAHIKSSLAGVSETVIIENGKLKLGLWQGVYFCEFDGPRNRQVWVKIIQG